MRDWRDYFPSCYGRSSSLPAGSWPIHSDRSPEVSNVPGYMRLGKWTMTAFAGFLLCLVLSAPAFAQTGSIGGTITDKDCQKLSYVNVAAKNSVTGMQRLSTTNEDGVYAIE